MLGLRYLGVCAGESSLGSLTLWLHLPSTGMGIDAADVFATLETRGVASFIDSWEALRSTVAAAAGVSA